MHQNSSEFLEMMKSAPNAASFFLSWKTLLYSYIVIISVYKVPLVVWRLFTPPRTPSISFGDHESFPENHRLPAHRFGKCEAPTCGFLIFLKKEKKKSIECLKKSLQKTQKRHTFSFLLSVFWKEIYPVFLSQSLS